MVVAGSVIGVGIFTTSGLVAASLPSVGWILAAWILGGVLSAAGALTNAEMGASLPHAGGDYVYLREAFHPALGFVAGWLSFFAIFCGTVGTLASGLAEYLSVLLPPLQGHVWQAGPVRIGGAQGAALFAVWASTALCGYGVREGARVQNLFSVAKISALVLLSISAPLLGARGVAALPVDPSVTLAVSWIPALGAALVPILFTYLGWNAPVYIASEIRDPARTLPRALLLGTALVTALYLIVNGVYLYALPLDQMFTLDAAGRRVGVVRIAELAAVSLIGPGGGRLVTVLVVLSIVGTLHATVLVGARIVYAMALDRTLPRAFAAVHPNRHTPHVALVLQAGIASLLLVTGSFGAILTYTTFAVISLMLLDGLALFRLRQRSDLARPYRVWGYPWVPGLYVLASLWLWLNTLVLQPLEAGLGLLIAATGLPAWWISRRGRARQAALPRP